MRIQRLRQSLLKDLVRNPYTQTFQVVKISSETLPLLESVPDHVDDKSIFNQHARSSLVLAQTSLTAIISDLREHTERISLIRKVEVLKNEDIQMEANRLKAASNFMNIKSGSTNYILTMDPELEYVCALLECEADSREQGTAPTDLIQNFLQELDAGNDNSGVFLYPSGVDVDTEICRAWCHDQIAILQMHESGLDQVNFLIQKSGFYKMYLQVWLIQVFFSLFRLLVLSLR
jgi:hypothetical protein